MKIYESYKDSGVGWIGEIPSHWSCVKVKHLLRERVDKSEDGIGEPLSMSQKYGLTQLQWLGISPIHPTPLSLYDSYFFIHKYH